MNFDYIYYFLFSFAITFILMPFGLKIIRRFNIVDKPDERKIHTLEISTGGGIIIFIGILLSSLIFLFNFSEYASITFPYLIGLLIIFVMGLMDDQNDLSPRVKLLTQIIASIIFIALSQQYINFYFMAN